MKIPLNKPYWGKKEETAVVSAMRTTIGSGSGPNNERMKRMLGDITGASFVLPMTSCTHALELAMIALGIGHGDEVILPSFTMTSTANAIVLTGATPVFADILPDSFNIDPDSIERSITKKTKGIIVVHYAGMACDMRRIQVIAKKHKLFVVEDAAHAIGATYFGKAMGTISDIGCFSFHGTKNISCGEGGALVTDRKAFVETMDVYRSNGTNRSAFLSGMVSMYSWVSPGSSYFLSDMLASIVCAQLTQLPAITRKRNDIAAYYHERLHGFENIMKLPGVTKGTKPNWHIYALKFGNVHKRSAFMDGMHKTGIGVASHYVPLHTSVMGLKLRKKVTKLPVTDDVAGTLVRLPIYPGLNRKELAFVVSSARRVLKALK